MTRELEQPAMQLDDFVKSCLEQIVTGVHAAQNAVVGYGACINPQVEGQDTIRGFDRQSGTSRQNIDFDVAVTVARNSKSGAGLKVAAFGLGGGIDGGSEFQQSAVSRIKFSIPVVFPKQLPRSPEQDDYVEPIQ